LLKQYIPVDSQGKCLQNVEAIEPGLENKRLALSDYLFVLSIENYPCHDYVTEKLYDPFHVGVVPIYLGAKNFPRHLLASKA